MPGFDLVGFYAILAPAGTPQEIVTKLHAAMVKTLEAPEVEKRLTGEGFEITGSSPGELDTFIRKEIVKYREIVRVANIRPE